MTISAHLSGPLVSREPVPAPQTLMPAPLDVHCTTIEEVPAGLAVEWAALAEEATEPNAFSEPWFVGPALRRLGGEVRLFEARRDGRLVGLMPLAVPPRYYRLPIRMVQNWGHDQSLLGTPLIGKGEEMAFWRVLLATLDAAPWTSGFLHLRDLAEDGPVHHALAAACAETGRPCDIVYREARAMLHSDLAPDTYYETHVRKKKRKELARLRNRLAEQGRLEVRELARAEEVPAWAEAYLALEAAGWKGEAGCAMTMLPNRAALFHDILAGAFAAGRLHFLRLDLDGQPIAMLVNLLSPPGGFAFKTTFDERFARFSPGVLLQIDNLRVLGRPDLGWMDSCAAPDHPMIDHLWAERRSVVRLNVALKGTRRRAIFHTVRTLEKASAALRGRKEQD